MIAQRCGAATIRPEPGESRDAVGRSLIVGGLLGNSSAVVIPVSWRSFRSVARVVDCATTRCPDGRPMADERSDPLALAAKLKRVLADAILDPGARQGRVRLTGLAGRPQEPQQTSRAASYLAHAPAIHLAKSDPAELLPVVQAVLAKLEHDYP